MFKNDEYSSFLNIFIFLVLKQYEFASFVFLFRPLGYPIKPFAHRVSPELCPPLTRERACSGNEIDNNP